MAGFGSALGHIAAGAGAGWAKGRMAEINRIEEGKLRELAEARADKRLATEMNFKREMADVEHTYRTEEISGNQAFQEKLTDKQIGADNERERKRIEQQNKELDANIDAKDKDRQVDKDKTAAEVSLRERLASVQVTKDDGTLGTVDISGAFKPVLDEKGKPVKTTAPAGATSANVQDMKYLTSLGVSEERATEMVFGGKGKSDPERRDTLVKTLIEAGKDNLGSTTPEELRALMKTSEQLADEYMAKGAAAAPAAAAGAVVTAETLTPEQKTQIIEETKVRSVGATPEQKAKARTKLTSLGINPAEAGL